MRQKAQIDQLPGCRTHNQIVPFALHANASRCRRQSDENQFRLFTHPVGDGFAVDVRLVHQHDRRRGHLVATHKGLDAGDLNRGRPVRARVTCLYRANVGNALVFQSRDGLIDQRDHRCAERDLAALGQSPSHDMRGNQRFPRSSRQRQDYTSVAPANGLTQAIKRVLLISP